jgi:hypothetical protein
MTEQKVTTEQGSETGVHSGVAIQGETQLREEALAAKDLLDKGYTRLARCLSDIYHQRLFKNWNHTTFSDYIKNELDFTERTSRYLIDVWDKAKDLNLPLDRIESIGWTKMARMVPVMNETNAEDWMQKGETMKTKDIELLVKRVRDPDATTPTITLLSFRLGTDDSTIVTEALTESKRIAENESPSVALTQICHDWLMQKGTNPERIDLGAHVSFLMKLFNVDITVADKDLELETPPPAAAPVAAKTEEVPLANDNDIDSLLGIRS